MARIELSNIGGGGTTLSLTTTGTSGASTLAGSVLNIPVYQGQLTLTTTGTSGAATLSGDILNIPNYATGGSPAGSAGQVQFNSTPAGSFAASANLAWDNSAVQLNIGAPSFPTGKLNVKGSGTLTTVNTRLTDSGNTELVKVLDNGSTNIGANFNWDNVNGRLGLGTSTPNQTLEVSGAMRLTGTAGTAAFMLGRNSAGDVSTVTLGTTGTSGAATLSANVLNIPQYQGALTLTTSGTGGAATLAGTTLNIPIYSGGASPGGSTGEIQYNNAGAFAASSNLAWDNTNVRLNIGAPSSPTGRLNVKGGGTTNATLNLSLTNSGNTNIFRVWDDATTQIGSNFYWDNANSRLGIGTTTPSNPLSIVAASGVTSYLSIERSGAPNGSFGIFNYTGSVGVFAPIFLGKSNFATIGTSFLLDCTSDVSTNGPICAFIARANNTASSNRTLFDFSNSDPSEISGGKSVLRIFASSNISIQNGGTPLNNGYRLDVNANGATHCTRLRAPNASSGTNVFLVQNNNPDDLHKIEANGKISYLANAISGTTGNQTINTPSGNVNFAGGATALTVTNSLCTTSSLVFATIRTNDATAVIKNVVPAAGSFTINLNAAATAVTSVGFFIIN